MYVEAIVNGKATKALVDTGATHNFVSEDEARRLELQASKEGGWLKAVNSAAKPSQGVARGVTMHIDYFRNASGAPARMLCMCTPAGQDEYFTRIGDVVAGKDAPPPQLSQDELAERRRRAAELASAYRSEFL